MTVLLLFGAALVAAVAVVLGLAACRMAHDADDDRRDLYLQLRERPRRGPWDEDDAA